MINFQNIYKLSKYFYKIKNTYLNKNINKRNLYVKHLKYHIAKGGNNNSYDVELLESLVDQLNELVNDIDSSSSKQINLLEKQKNKLETQLEIIKIIFEQNKTNSNNTNNIKQIQLIYTNILQKIKNILENIKINKINQNNAQNEKKCISDEINKLSDDKKKIIRKNKVIGRKN